MIDLEFDPFRDRMPKQHLFYAELANLATERAQELTELCKQKFGKLVQFCPDECVSVSFDFDQRVAATALGAEAIRGERVDLYRTESLIEVSMSLYRDGSPYVRDADLDFLDGRAHTLAHDGYRVWASAEMPPVAVPNAVSDLVEDMLIDQYRAVPEHLRNPNQSAIPVIDAVRQIGYEPPVLTAEDCDGVLAAVCQFEIDPNWSMVQLWGSDWHALAPDVDR